MNWVLVVLFYLFITYNAICLREFMEKNQPKRITYLFGAGASIGNGKLLSDDKPTGIPVVEKFNDDISVFIDLIDDVNIMSSGEEKMRQFGFVPSCNCDQDPATRYAVHEKERRKSLSCENVSILTVNVLN